MASPWDDAVLAATLFALDPLGTAGVRVRAPAGPVRDRWLALLRERLPAATRVQRVPLQITDDRLLGGLDLAATLAAGRPVAQRGLLADADGGVLLLAMAERISPAAAARLAAVLDAGEIVLERDGFASRTATRFGVVAFDEGSADDEQPPAALLDRLAFHLNLSALALRDGDIRRPADTDIALARTRLAHMRTHPEAIEALCGVAHALGIASLRAPLLALRAACALAALAGRTEASADDVVLAGRLVLAPRATRLPAEEAAPDAGDEPGAPDESQSSAGADADPDDPGDRDPDQRPLEDRVLDAARAAIPADVLARLRLGDAGLHRAGSMGKAGAARESALRGRPIGTRRGALRSGPRLNVLATLRAAAPWQVVRRAERTGPSVPGCAAPRIIVRRDDFQITRYRQRTQTTTIFVVDASGSTALNRLAEAKGAVELLLADCYVRRDQVALLAFRGRGAELLLPPTRSLVRAKRSLAALPGGGGTPLAAGLLAALEVAQLALRRGETPVVVVLTDGRANVARDGSGGRERGFADARQAARMVRAAGLTAVWVDTSPQPQPQAQVLAAEMQARYVPLPHAGAAAISAAVRVNAAAPGKREPGKA